MFGRPEKLMLKTKVCSVAILAQAMLAQGARLKGIPKRLFGQVFFLEAWGTKAKNRTFSRNQLFFGLAADGGKAKQPFFSRKYMVSCPWHPGPPKNHLAQKPLRDPFDLQVVRQVVSQAAWHGLAHHWRLH